MGTRKHTGCIYKEIHNHGRRSSGSQDGNACSYRRVKGVGMSRVSGYRWVAEIVIDRKRYRKRSYHYDVVRDWLNGMIECFAPEKK